MYSHAISEEKIDTINRTKLVSTLVYAEHCSGRDLRYDRDDEGVRNACDFEEVLHLTVS